MRALLIHPAFPVTYWGFQLGLPLAGRRASLPPLGLLTLAALLPQEVDCRLVDLNAEPLTDADLAWADVVLVGGMRIQAPSMHRAVARAKAAGRRVAVGGPAVTTAPEAFADADVVFVGEAEGRIPELMAALRQGGPARLEGEGHPGIDASPIPRFDLLVPGRYASMSLQYSRGCPYRCEFCDIIEIFGRVPRVKRPAQVLAELTALYATGYRGSVFFVDDNFIGNRPQVRALLPELTRWQAAKGYPFELYTEATINLAGDDALLRAMTGAGFSSVFVGLETPSEASLKCAGKTQNLGLDLGDAVEHLSRAGLEVMSGFIVGFDTDGPEVFAAQRRFIQASPIPLAMVGILTALPGTALWRRLAAEGRLREDADTATGDAFARPNFTPALDEATLIAGYRDLLAGLYTEDAWWARVERHLALAPPVPGRRRPMAKDVATFFRVAARVGLDRRAGPGYRRLVRRVVAEQPGHLPFLVAHAVMGHHMVRYTRETVIPRLDAALSELGVGRVPARAPAYEASAAASGSATARSAAGGSTSKRTTTRSAVRSAPSIAR